MTVSFTCHDCNYQITNFALIEPPPHGRSVVCDFVAAAHRHTRGARRAHALGHVTNARSGRDIENRRSIAN